MRLTLAALLLTGIPWAAAQAQPLPPIQTPEQAVQQLSLVREDTQVSALSNLKTACRGRLRHTLKDNKPVLSAVEKLLEEGSAPVRRGALDVVRCFAAANVPRLLALGLDATDPQVTSYAAEIAAQVPEPPVTELLLARLEEVGADCADPKAKAELAERCVWLVYSSGATVGPGHSRALRERIGEAIEAQLASPHPKVREVAVETLGRTRLSAHAQAIERLVEQEKKGTFSKKNEAALLRRFDASAKLLKQKGEK
jgi:hypothetical protein